MFCNIYNRECCYVTIKTIYVTQLTHKNVLLRNYLTKGNIYIKTFLFPKNLCSAELKKNRINTKLTNVSKLLRSKLKTEFK